ncbi:MAG: alpha amylase C-terminal domain-containing protein, partial [Betaproteobacteria bacterium]
DAQLDWAALDDARHQGVQRLIGDLNRVYCELPALHACDCEPRGFEWVDFADHEQSVIAFLRRGVDDAQLVVAVCNFTPVPRHGYRIGVPYGGSNGDGGGAGWYREIINTDAAIYGGSNVGNGGGLTAVAAPCHGRTHSIVVTLPPLACVMFEWVRS